MDLTHLRENRRHGTQGFPVGVYRVEQPAGRTILDNHWHDEMEFLFVESGQAVFQIGTAEYEVHAGEAIAVPCGEIHGGYPLEQSPCTYAAIVFDLEWLINGRDGDSARFLQRLLRGRAALPPKLDPASPWGRKAIRRLKRLFKLYESADPAKEMKVTGELYLLLAEFWSAGAWSPRGLETPSEARTLERLKEALKVAEQNFGRKLTVRELADAAGMSEGHFSRLFKAYMRRTPVEYVNLLRLRYAARRLADSDATVGEVAAEAGFDNFSYFSKLFRALYDCTPSAYRKSRGYAGPVRK
ncbi:MAG: hypothetical protein C6P35_08440 [Cohnella sp.]|uniref:AraC family transcriptional regulator n=1 Tax=Cohnella sp. TaxID=1883426 RepID=UPI000E3ABB34|nr:AraC family transcriptional regulator [Cohnella sp.]REK66045.1 MAG: hypothetical protein C6P35_08440 [Cohnella sp.]